MELPIHRAGTWQDIGAAFVTAVVLLIAPVGSAFADGQIQLVRRPYLQLGTPNSMIVRWRTDVPAGTTLRYGTDPNQLIQTLSDSRFVSEHEVAIQNLSRRDPLFLQCGHSHRGPGNRPGSLFRDFTRAWRPGRNASVGDRGFRLELAQIGRRTRSLPGIRR